MSLKDAVLSVAEALESEISENDHNGDPIHSYRVQDKLKSIMRELRLIVKAAEGNSAPSPPMVIPNQVTDSGIAFHRSMIEAEKERIRTAKNIAPAVSAEEAGPRGVLAVGGPVDGDIIQIPSDVPNRSKSVIAGAVYILDNDKLHCIETEMSQAKSIILP